MSSGGTPRTRNKLGLGRRLLGLRWWQHAAVIAMVVGLTFTVVEVNTAYFRDLASVSIYGAKPHRVPCSEWPTANEVEQLVVRKDQVVREIESVKPGGIKVVVNSRRCSGKAEILIYFEARHHIAEIKRIIGDEKYFFGVPYTLANW